MAGKVEPEWRDRFLHNRRGSIQGTRRIVVAASCRRPSPSAHCQTTRSVKRASFDVGGALRTYSAVQSRKPFRAPSNSQPIRGDDVAAGVAGWIRLHSWLLDILWFVCSCCRWCAGRLVPSPFPPANWRRQNASGYAESAKGKANAAICDLVPSLRS